MSAEPPLSGTAEVGGGGRSVTVLVVDDNEVALRLCRRVLEKAGYKVLTASDGLEAVSLALANSLDMILQDEHPPESPQPDMILLDEAMPGMDSLWATRQIKKQRPGIAIVITSVHPTASDRERFLAAGADDVLSKPFRLSDMLAVVAKLTANRGPQMKDLIEELDHGIAVTGQASKLDTALDALGEVSQALTTVTQSSKVLEQKTLETAVRVTMASAGLLTRTTADGSQATIMSLGLPSAVDDLVVQNGQGIIGAVIRSGRATAVTDISQSSVLQSPPDLVQYGLRAAICVPMLEDGRLWGTLSVFDVKKREWTTDDQRVLATLGNLGVVAVRNSELYDNNQRSIWELRNLREALQAATSTLDLNQVLQQVLAGAAKASSAQIGCLALDESGKLVLKGGFGTDSTTAEKLALGVGGDICRDVMASGSPFMEAREQNSMNDSPLNPRAVLCIPITLRSKPLGVLFLANYRVGHGFTADHRNLVTEIAALAALAIDNARLFKDRGGTSGGI